MLFAIGDLIDAKNIVQWLMACLHVELSPTSAQFGDLIDSALMARYIWETSSIAAIGNTVYMSNATVSQTIDMSLVELGESIVFNKVGEAVGLNLLPTFSGIGIARRFAAGYYDVSADSVGVMSYAVLITNMSPTLMTAKVALINRAFYK